MTSSLTGCASLGCVIKTPEHGTLEPCLCCRPPRSAKIIKAYQIEVVALQEKLRLLRDKLEKSEAFSKQLLAESEESDDYDGANFLV